MSTSPSTNAESSQVALNIDHLIPGFQVDFP